MKEIGSIDDSRDAELFHSYLRSRDIKSRVDREGGRFQIWVYDYDEVDSAKEEFTRFLKSNDRSPFTRAVDEFHTKERAARKQRGRQLAKKPKQVDGAVPFLHQIPLTMGLVAVCLVMFAISMGSAGDRLSDRLEISAMPTAETAVDLNLPLVHYGRLREVSHGQIWRLVTPIFLHRNLPHVFFNMLWLIQLGGAIEYRRGSKQFLILVLVVAALSNVAQFVYAGPRFVGISGVDAGLFGYLLVFSRFAPEEGLGIDSRTMLIMFLYLGLCLTPIITDTANASHLVGLASGAGIAALTIGYRRSREEFNRSRSPD